MTVQAWFTENTNTITLEQRAAYAEIIGINNQVIPIGNIVAGRQLIRCLVNDFQAIYDLLIAAGKEPRICGVRNFAGDWIVESTDDGDNLIIAGHGRVMAAKKLGLKTVPVIELSDLTEAQKKAYILADNKLALNSGWDDELLKLELQGLEDLGFDLELTGFDPLEMANLFDDGVRDVGDSSSKEIDTDSYNMQHTCPKCGFEFDNK